MLRQSTEHTSMGGGGKTHPWSIEVNSAATEELLASTPDGTTQETPLYHFAGFTMRPEPQPHADDTGPRSAYAAFRVPTSRTIGATAVVRCEELDCAMRVAGCGG